MKQIYSQTNRRGQATIFNYDLSGNVESVASPTTTIATSFDNWDRPTNITLTGIGDTGTHILTHDILGRVLILDGPWSDDTLTWTYNDAQRRVVRTATGAEGSYTETSTADTLGRLAGVINPLGTFTMAYSGNTSRPTAITHSGGFDTTFSYTGPEQGRALSEILSKLPGGATVARHSYTYDQLGQIATWKREAPLPNPGTTHQYEWSLAHDYSGQLTSVIEKSLTGSLRDGWAFGYDAAGNRQSTTRSGAPGGTAQAMTATHNPMNQITTLGGGGRTMVAGSLNEPGQVAVGLAGQGDHPARMLSGNRFETELDLPAGTSTLEITATDSSANTTQKKYTVATSPETARTFTYDADGNLTSDGVRTYEWDAWSRLTKINWATGKTTDISYNALGQRSKLVHTDGGTTRTEYLIYDGAELLQRRTNGTAAANTDRVYFAQGERRKTGSSWGNQFYTRDHLGSVREVLAANGTLLARYDYTPYGERETRYQASGYDGTDFGFTGHITLKSPVAGQRELVLAHFRAYDPVIGRWLSQDLIREAGGVNLYGYVGGKVSSMSDPMGLWQVDITIAWGIGVSISFGSNSGRSNFEIAIVEGAALSGALNLEDAGSFRPCGSGLSGRGFVTGGASLDAGKFAGVGLAGKSGGYGQTSNDEVGAFFDLQAYGRFLKWQEGRGGTFVQPFERGENPLSPPLQGDISPFSGSSYSPPPHKFGVSAFWGVGVGLEWDNSDAADLSECPEHLR